MQLHFTITVLFLSFLNFGNAWGGGDKVKLKDLSTLTLYHGKMTTARRSHPVPQLNCVGGTAGCSAFVPRVVQCYNKGWDGNDVQWKCETDMDNAYRFGSVEVSCEGYDYPEDPYVLKGSCGLEYTIDLTKEGNAQQSHNYYGGNDHGNKYATHTSKKSSPFGDVILLGVVALVIYALYKTCLSQQVTTGEDTGDDHGPGGPRRPGWFNSWFGGGGNGYGNQAPPPGFRPEYYGTGDAGCGSTGGRAASGGGGGGFWTGAATGGLLGYMFGNRMAGDNTYRRGAYPAAGGGGWFQSGRTNYSGYASTSTAPSPSTGTRTASGFGGTRRR